MDHRASVGHDNNSEKNDQSNEDSGNGEDTDVSTYIRGKWVLKERLRKEGETIMTSRSLVWVTRQMPSH